MALTSAWVQSYKQLPKLFDQIRDGQAPERVTQQLLKDWGFKGSNDRRYIPFSKLWAF